MSRAKYSNSNGGVALRTPIRERINSNVSEIWTRPYYIHQKPPTLSIENGGHLYPKDHTEKGNMAGYCSFGCGSWYSPGGIESRKSSKIDTLGKCPNNIMNRHNS